MHCFIVEDTKYEVGDKDAKTKAAGKKGKTCVKKTFPLKDSHVFRIVCLDCLKPLVDQDFRVSYKVDQQHHKCHKDILVVAHKVDDDKGKLDKYKWLKMRERSGTKPGKYSLCEYYTADPQQPCPGGEVQCPLPHSQEEQTLWNKEKHDEFNIAKFIEENKYVKSVTEEITGPQVKVDGTTVPLLLMCKYCFIQKQKDLGGVDQQTSKRCTKKTHNTDKLLVGILNRRAHPIRVPPMEVITWGTRYQPIKACSSALKKVQCNAWKSTYGKICPYSHNKVEHEVWLWQIKHNGEVYSYYELVHM